MYNVIAKNYTFLGYDKFSSLLKPKLSQYLSDINFKFDSHLDLACGTGALCKALSNEGINSHGVDISSKMIEIAKLGTEKSSLNPTFEIGDMRNYKCEQKYDLVTCVHDSINHICEINELRQMFRNVNKILNPNGLFIFDVNTIKQIYENWGEGSILKHLDNNTLLLMEASIDKNQNLAHGSFHLFSNIDKDMYQYEVDSITEKGYQIDDIREAIFSSGFNNFEILDTSFMRALDPEKEFKVFFILSK